MVRTCVGVGECFRAWVRVWIMVTCRTWVRVRAWRVRAWVRAWVRVRVRAWVRVRVRAWVRIRVCWL